MQAADVADVIGFALFDNVDNVNSGVKKTMRKLSKRMNEDGKERENLVHKGEMPKKKTFERGRDDNVFVRDRERERS